jgi:hypothetical protein
MISPVRAVDFDLLFDLDDWLNRERKLLRASLQLLGHHSPIELPVTLSVDATHGQAFRLNSFILGSIIAFVKQFEEISLLVATKTRGEAEALGIVPVCPSTIEGVHFGRKQVPSDESVKKMKDVLYPELSEAEVRTLHDRRTRKAPST